eukprot:augustus_masked-scaffold_5-processed-gene-11.33-mRNA-1 protein AED:1.00 eAED:1.00 QI:0/-1/0/0/-1/1/1/0/300
MPLLAIVISLKMFNRSEKKRQQELKELLERAEKLKKKFPEFIAETDLKKEKLASGDEFLSKKSELIKKITELKQESAKLKELETKKPSGSSIASNSLDIISKKQEMRKGIYEIQEIKNKMQSLCEKESKKRKSTLSQPELQARVTVLNQLQVQINALQTKSGSNGDSASLFRPTTTPTFTIAGSESNGESVSDLGSDQQLEQIKQRDLEFDKILEQIEFAVDRAGEIAKSIHNESNLQNKMLDQVDVKVGKVQDHIDSVNEKMKKTLVDSYGCGFERFCTNAICLIIFLALLGVVLDLAN